jgi:hypothetical protein
MLPSPATERRTSRNVGPGPQLMSCEAQRGERATGFEPAFTHDPPANRAVRNVDRVRCQNPVRVTRSQDLQAKREFRPQV